MNNLAPDNQELLSLKGLSLKFQQILNLITRQKELLAWGEFIKSPVVLYPIKIIQNYMIKVQFASLNYEFSK